MVCGIGSHSTGSDGFEGGLSYRGRFASELAVAVMMVTTVPMCPMPSGRIALSKKTLTSYGVLMMKWLGEYETFRIIQKRPDYQIAGLPGRYVREYLIDCGWLMKGLTNLDPIDFLHPYEQMKCFRTIQSRFYHTGLISFCGCTTQCLLKKTMFALIGITYDFACRMSYFGVTFSVADFFGKDTVDNFVRYCTTKSDCPGMFFPTPVIGSSIILNERHVKTYLTKSKLDTVVLYGSPSV